MASATLAALHAVHAEPPPNDDCLGATPLLGEGIFAFDNTEADPAFHPGPCYMTQDVWYVWTSTCTGSVTIDTCGTTLVNTVLAVYKNMDCPPGPGDLISCDPGSELNNSGRASCDFQFRVSFLTTQGSQYLLQLGAYLADENMNGGSGYFTIHCADWDDLPCVWQGEHCLPAECLPPFPPCPDWDEPCSPPEENCHPPDSFNALASDRDTRVAANRFTAAAEGGVTDVCWWGLYFDGETDCSFGVEDAFEVRYYVDDNGVPGALAAGPFAQANGTFTMEGPVRTGRFIADVAHEYEYKATHDPVPLSASECYWIEITNSTASMDHPCRWHWSTTQHALGRAVQDGRADQPANGYEPDDVIDEELAFCLNLPLEETAPCGAPPGNDDCANAQLISEGEHYFETLGATTDGPPQPEYCPPGTPDCCAFPLGDEQIHKNLWYNYTASCTGTLTIDVVGADFDTKVAVYEGWSCPPSALAVACDDDIDLARNLLSSRAVLPVTVGDPYKIRVGGFRGAGGAGHIRVTCAPPPSNDECNSVVVQTFLPFAAAGTSLNSVSDCPLFRGTEAWIAFELGLPASIELDYCYSPSPFATALPFLTKACPCDELMPADRVDACEDGNPRLAWDCLPAGTYYHPILAEPGSEGMYQILATRADCVDVCAGAQGACLINHGTPGCDEPICCAAVCALDEYCCKSLWDGLCANAATILCDQFPQTVCAEAQGDCFEPHTTPGCDDPTTCERVCDCDPFCCLVEWDVHCAFFGFPGTGCGGAADCNANGVLDDEDIEGPDHPDCNDNTLPDDCDAMEGGDFDADGDRDLDDYGHFMHCLNGPAHRPNPPDWRCIGSCLRTFDLAPSLPPGPPGHTVDLADFAALQNAFGQEAP